MHAMLAGRALGAVSITLIEYGGTTAAHTLGHRSIGCRPSVGSGDGCDLRRGASVRFGHGRADRGRYRLADEATPPPRKEEPPKPQPSDAFDSLSSKATASSVPEPAVGPQQQAALSTPPPVRQQASAKPPPPSASPAPGFVPPEPDLSIKYHVILGLPPELPQNMPKGNRGDFFVPSSRKPAIITSGLVTVFRHHLKSPRCCRDRSHPPTSSRSRCGCS